MSMSKQQVAVIVVILDLVICYFFWFSLLAMKPLEDAISTSISLNQLDPSDFTIVIKQEPYLDKYEELRPIYWAWCENILELDSNRLKEVDQTVDRNQDLVLNVNFGLMSYGHLLYYKKMSNLLNEKKSFEK